MIVPSGTRRDQVAQGGMRSRSIFDSDLFDAVKISQNMVEQDQPGANAPKDLKVNELEGLGNDGEPSVQDAMNDSNSLVPPQPEPQQQPDQPDMGGQGTVIDISKHISDKVIHALGLNKRPNEQWQGKTEIANDGNEVVGITIKLTRAQPANIQTRVAPGEPPLGADLGGKGPAGPVTNSV